MNHLLRIVGSSAIACVLSGCHAGFWSWAGWPSIVENTDGLGTSPIGDYVRERSGQIDDLKLLIIDFVKEQTSARGVSRKDAESLGMQCAPAPGTECTYSGEYWYREYGHRRESPHYGKRIIQHIDVRFSYLKPHEVVVQIDEQDVPDE